jgi:hypothetical protein
VTEVVLRWLGLSGSLAVRRDGRGSSGGRGREESHRWHDAGEAVDPAPEERRRILTCVRGCSLRVAQSQLAALEAAQFQQACEENLAMMVHAPHCLCGQAPVPDPYMSGQEAAAKERAASLQAALATAEQHYPDCHVQHVKVPGDGKCQEGSFNEAVVAAGRPPLDLDRFDSVQWLVEHLDNLVYLRGADVS